MARMRRFLTYFLCLVGFILLSYLLENALLENMYIKMAGSVDSPYEGIEIGDVEGKASNVNGYMSFKITDNSQDGKEKYAKIDLYNKKGNLVATKYVALEDLDENHQKTYQIKIKGQEIRNYKISIIDELPDKSNIINLFGWEFDASNVFGLDLSNATLFGKKLTDLFSGNDVFNKEGIKGGLLGIWNWFISLTRSIPWWGYAIAAGIIIWYMPARYLFGIFP